MALIKITKGYIKNFLIPHYQNDLRPIYDSITKNCGVIKVGTTFHNYIYGYSIKAVKDLWAKLPLTPPYSYVVPNGHQRRQFHATSKPYAPIASNPVNITTLSQCTNFEDIYEYVFNVFISAGSLAPLTIYDTAYRIGFNMTPQILPNKFVYLSAGALNGAECLYGKKWVIVNKDKVFSLKGKNFIRIRTSAFKQIFPGLDSVGVENVLCDFFDL